MLKEHAFATGDESHSCYDKINEALNVLLERMEREGKPKPKLHQTLTAYTLSLISRLSSHFLDESQEQRRRRLSPSNNAAASSIFTGPPASFSGILYHHSSPSRGRVVGRQGWFGLL
ncbi:hypothetical protein LWI29_004623 [Acer saccharum]|uniref:Uncharacterized protein n=1 Tax=Acer saccharum TaxID=4024 RepID=A0AA39SXA8_ACESA|nr:hypothetical protein LWI29_004623 [Acer saccharum]